MSKMFRAGTHGYKCGIKSAPATKEVAQKAHSAFMRALTVFVPTADNDWGLAELKRAFNATLPHVLIAC